MQMSVARAGMATSSLPLQCSICPKQPKFSDVSHLLTHVASKSHLSHYYKTRLRSLTDPIAGRLLESYNEWYMNSDIETLMSNRLRSKETRRGKPKVKSKPLPKSQMKALKNVQSVDTASSARTIGIETRLLSVLDPQLDPSLQDSILSLTGDNHTLHSHVIQGFGDRFTTAKSKRPRLYLFQTNRPGSYRALSLEVDDSISAYPLDFLESSVSSETAPVVGKTEKQTRGPGDDSSKLKGVLWPGMAIFDAATPSMKRKRNQKKDTSVIEHLERRSLQVEATECIYTPQGSLKKSRPISGQVDPDSSPLGPPKYRSDDRIPLSEMSSNVFAKHDQRPRQPIPKFNLQHRKPISNSQETARTSRGRSFQVHVDTEPFGNPTGMSVLTSTFHAPQIYDYVESVPDTITTVESNDGPYFPQMMRMPQATSTDAVHISDTTSDGMYQLLQQIYYWAEQDPEAHAADDEDDGTISELSVL